MGQTVSWWLDKEVGMKRLRPRSGIKTFTNSQNGGGGHEGDLERKSGWEGRRKLYTESGIHLGFGIFA